VKTVRRIKVNYKRR